jgi:hypothetical protein
VLPFQLATYLSDRVGGDPVVSGYRAAYASSIDELDPGALDGIEDGLEGVSALIRHRPQLRDPSQVARAAGAVVTRKESPWADVRAAEPHSRDYWDGIVTDRGTNTLYDAIPDQATIDTAMAARYTTWMSQGTEMRSLRAMLEGLTAQGVDVVLFAPPLDRVTLGASGLDFSAMDAGVEQMALEAERADVPFIDLFTDPYDVGDFNDKVHLNLRGTQRMSRDLASHLDELCASGALSSCASA